MSDIDPRTGYDKETASITIVDNDHIFESYELCHHYEYSVDESGLEITSYNGTTMFFSLNDGVLLNEQILCYTKSLEGDSLLSNYSTVDVSYINSANSYQYQCYLNGCIRDVKYVTHYEDGDEPYESYYDGSITACFYGMPIQSLKPYSNTCVNGYYLKEYNDQTEQYDILTSFTMGIFFDEKPEYWKKNQWTFMTLSGGMMLAKGTNQYNCKTDIFYPYFQGYRYCRSISTSDINNFIYNIDNRYSFIYGVSTRSYYECDVSGYIYNIDGSLCTSSYLGQMNELSADDVKIFTSCEIEISNDIYYKCLLDEIDVDDINMGRHRPNGNDDGTISTINDEYPYTSGRLWWYENPILLSANDDTSLKENLLKIKVSEQTKLSNSILLGYVGVSNPSLDAFNGLCNIIDGTFLPQSDISAKLMFIPMKPLTTDEKTANGNVDKFWPANVMLYPVFIKNIHAILNLIGSTDEFILNDYNAFKDSFQTNLVSSYNNNIVVEELDVRSQTKEDFMNKVKASVRYDTLFMYVFSHGYRDVFKGEGTALQNVVGLEEGIKSSMMYKLLTTTAKNVVFQSIACYGAGTIRPDYKPHDFPDVFPPKETLSGKDGKSIMYIVDDVANSPAWSINDKSFSSRFIPLYFNNGYTYEQVVQHFNETIKATKTSIFKTLKKMYKSMMDENCLLACMDDYNGNKIPVFKDYHKFLSENQLVIDDLNRFGLKYIVDNKHHEYFNIQLAFFKILLGIITNTKDRLLISLYFDSLDDMLESSSSVLQLNTEKAKKAYAAWYKELVTPINVPDMIENTSPMTNFIGDDYDKYINNRDTIQEVYVRNMYKFLYDVIKQSQFIMYDKDMPGYSKTYLKIHKVRDNAIKTYLNATSNFTKLLISGMYEIYSNVLNYLNNRYPAMKIKDMYCEEIYVMICRNFIEDHPCAGFLKATPEFKAKKFMT